MAEEIKKPETEIGGKEREFIIPLRRKFKKTASYRRAPKAIRAIKEFLVRHMKIYDRNLKKIKLDRYLNEFIWTRGIKNPPAKIKIKAVVDGDFIRAELAELPERLKFRKEKQGKRGKKTEKAGGKTGQTSDKNFQAAEETEKNGSSKITILRTPKSHSEEWLCRNKSEFFKVTYLLFPQAWRLYYLHNSWFPEAFFPTATLPSRI